MNLRSLAVSLGVPKYRPGISDKNLPSKLKYGIITEDIGLQKQRMTKLGLKKPPLYF